MFVYLFGKLGLDELFFPSRVYVVIEVYVRPLYTKICQGLQQQRQEQ